MRLKTALLAWLAAAALAGAQEVRPREPLLQDHEAP